MKIQVPKKYLGKFKNKKAYVMRWKNRSALLTNEKIRDKIADDLETIIDEKEANSAFARMFRAGIFEVELDKDGFMECPDWLAQWLGNGTVIYKKDRLGLLVQPKM